MLSYLVYNQAIVVPETIDASWALTAMKKDGATSVHQADITFGAVREFVPVGNPVTA